MKYLKGQLHIHTSMSDGDATPEIVAQEFKNMGYDFICFTDHYKNFDPSYINIEDFLIIPGSEFASIVENPYYNDIVKLHINALGFLGENTEKLDYYIKQYLDAFHYPNKDNTKYTGKTLYCEKSISDTINLMIEEILKLGAIPTINHPNWFNFDFENPKLPNVKCDENGNIIEKEGYNFAPFDYRDLLNVKYPFILEVKNVSLPDYSDGYKSLESGEYIWDVLLSNGKKIYGEFSDDSHNYNKEIRNQITKYHCPGQTSVMVMADLNEKSIKKALVNGDFYTTTGPELEYYEVTEKSIKLKVKEKTGEKYSIILKGKMGLPLKWTNKTEIEFDLTEYKEDYVRVKISNNLYQMALCQPVFLKK